MEKIKDIKSPFMCYCAKVIPLAFDESMSYYECLCNFYNYLKNEVMPVINNNADATKELQDLFIELENYVNHYFDNLDIQEEINNKLDDMYENGQLTSLITSYLELQTTYCFDTLSDMKEATNFINGCYAKTLGYNELNDGGKSYYKIRTKTEEDIIDDIFIIELDDENLIGELLIENNEINVRQAGINGDPTEDATTLLTKVFAKGYDIYFPTGTYNVTNTLTLLSHKLHGSINKDSIIKLNSETNKQLIYSNNLTNVEIKNLKFNLNELTDTLQSNINLFNTIGLKIENCEFTGGNGTQLRLNGSTDVDINNCYFHHVTGDDTNPGEAIYYNGGNNIRIVKCNSDFLHDHFLYLDGSTPINNVYVNNCYIKRSGYEMVTENGGGIAIYGACTNITIDNCIIEKSRNGINIAKRNNILPQNIFINNNHIFDSEQDGIYAESDGLYLNNNILNDNGYNGLDLRYGKNLYISNNKCYNNTTTGLNIRNGEYIDINNCTFYNNNSSGMTIGYNTSNVCYHVKISNCIAYATASGTQLTGIQILDSDDVIITTCKSFNNTSVNYDTQRSVSLNLVSQLNSDRQTQINSLMYRDTIPMSATYKRGDTILYTSPSANGHIGAVCVSGGTPGTWKEFGKIDN